MATINAQLGIANFDLSIDAENTEQSESSGFLAALAAVQGDVESDQQSESKSHQDNMLHSDENTAHHNNSTKLESGSKQVEQPSVATSLTETVMIDDEIVEVNTQQSFVTDGDDVLGATNTEVPIITNTKSTAVTNTKSTDIPNIEGAVHTSAQVDKIFTSSLKSEEHADDTASLSRVQLNTQSASQWALDANSGDKPHEIIKSATVNTFHDETNRDTLQILEQLSQSKAYAVSLSKSTSDKSLSHKNETLITNSSMTNTVDEHNDGSVIDLDVELKQLDDSTLVELKQLLMRLEKHVQGLSTNIHAESKHLLEKVNAALSKIVNDSQALQTKTLLPLSEESSAKDVLISPKSPNGSLAELKQDAKSSEKKASVNSNEKVHGTDRLMQWQSPQSVKTAERNVLDDSVNKVTELFLFSEKEAKLPAQPENSLDYKTAILPQHKTHSTSHTKIELAHTGVDESVLAEDKTQGQMESEQTISFSKLLNVLKTNANTPALTQLVSQIQMSHIQLNQNQHDELTSFNEQVIHQQATQLSRSMTQTTVATEQALQQPINIARTDAAKVLFDKATMLLNLNLKEAEIRLDPPELGSMQIRIRSDAEQAQINFVVQNQQAKDLLEQSMSKLRELLAEQGINLGDSNVSEQGKEQEQLAQQDNSAIEQEAQLDVNKDGTGQIVSKQQGGIDFYA